MKDSNRTKINIKVSLSLSRWWAFRSIKVPEPKVMLSFQNCMASEMRFRDLVIWLCLPFGWKSYVSLTFNRKPKFSSLFLFNFFFSLQHQKKLTTGIENILYFTLFILPVLQYVIPIALLGSGLLLIISGVRGCISNQTHNLHHSPKSKQTKRTKRTKTNQLPEKMPNTWQQSNTKSDLCIKA